MANADWQAATLRIALFTQQALSLATDVFTAFTGGPPDRQEDRPKEGTRQQIGRFEDAELRVSVTPIMIDFVVSPPAPTPQNIMGDLPFSTGELKAELAKLERKFLAWLPKWEVPTTRVALIVQARAPASSPEAAYEILRDNLASVQVKPGEMTDLIFRVNWKAKTKIIPEGYFNRVSTWTALRVRKLAGSGLGGPEVTLEDRDFAQMELDINTPAERHEPLPRDKMIPIYKEFFHLAITIAQDGEGP